jgi:hypothetical protein
MRDVIVFLQIVWNLSLRDYAKNGSTFIRTQMIGEVGGGMMCLSLVVQALRVVASLNLI